MKPRRSKSRASSPAPLSPGRRWLFRFIAAVVLPLLLLVAAELALRLAGYGYDPRLFRRETIQGREFLVNNHTFGLRFFPPELVRFPGAMRLPVPKPPGTIRIFVLGESAAMGDPEPAFGASRYLEALLNGRYPRVSFEVVNLGITAINSHVIRPVAREAADAEGDIWIVYMGNNEMVGPFGAATVFGEQAAPLPVVRLNLALQRTRLGQWFAVQGRKWRRGGGVATEWGGMNMFAGNQVPAADPRRAVVHANFQQNLDDIVRMGLDSGATVLLNTMAVNLRDCPPFASAPPMEAAPLFREGQALLADGLGVAAREKFQAACDVDALPFRADGPINAAVRSTAQRLAGGRLVLVDAAGVLGRGQLAEACGDETFFEHVHFNFDGSYRLALAWAEHIAAVLPKHVQPSVPARSWAAQADCERRLGLSDWNRVLVLEHMAERLQQPPLNTQVNNAARLAALRTQITGLRARLTPANAEVARAEFQRQLTAFPDDSALRESYALFLQSIGDLPGATAEWRRVCDQLPHDYLGHFQLGRLLVLQNQGVEAETELRRAVGIHPALVEGWIELANACALQDKPAVALAALERARRQRPGDARIALAGARIQVRAKDATGAIRTYREVVRLNPGNWEVHFELGGVLDAADELDAARAAFAEAARLNPTHVRARFNHGVLLAKLGRLDEAQREFEAALQLDPHYEPARESLGKIELLRQRAPR